MKLKLAVTGLLLAVVTGAPGSNDDGDWRVFGRDPGAQRFSPLTQITTRNVGTLETAWTFDTGVKDLQVTPLVIDGMMYVTGGSTVYALEPETGKTLWKYSSPSGAVSRRGVAYWPGRGTVAPRLFSGRVMAA